LRDWLAEVRSSARARPLEANLARGPLGYSGSIVVALPGGTGP
jgi:general secretion pathway protein M